ncbi:hypothetical protein ES705_15384 [subsurface metagenome]
MKSVLKQNNLKMKKRLLTFKIPDQDRRKIRAFAGSRDTTASDLIREAIKENLKGIDLTTILPVPKIKAKQRNPVQKNMVVILDEQDRDKIFAVAEMKGITISDLVRPWIKKITENWVATEMKMDHRKEGKLKIMNHWGFNMQPQLNI